MVASANFLKKQPLIFRRFLTGLEKRRVNVKKIAVILSLTIEKIGLIYLTNNLFEIKVNVFCRVNLVFMVRLSPSKTRH